MTTRHLVFLLGIICFPPATAFAQDEAERMAIVLAAGDPEAEALARYKLTAENVRKMFAVDRELFVLFKEDADFRRRMSEPMPIDDPRRKLGTIALQAQLYEDTPEIARILRKHQISGREYMFTYAVARTTVMIDFMVSQQTQPDGRNMVPPEFNTHGLKFWRSMDPSLKAEAEAWKKMWGYDKGINR